jgi:lipopolysaccharide/colanic/teichoic acid biosynthesis glycosyltransferase
LLQVATRYDPSSIADVELAPALYGRWSYATTGKRALDVVLAVLLIIATLPLWIAIAIAIRVESEGPAIFVQDRVGLRGRRFRFYKFRSMQQDAEARRQELQSFNEMGGPVFKIRTDPRITRVGRLLRRTSLDELPQLVNVLKGQMSIVGPRPPRPDEVKHYRPSDMVRLVLKPGLTCWWQIRGRSDIDFDTWMAYDREYVYGVSLLTDLRIILGTFHAVVTGRGAY